jgi:MFS family permease
MQNVLHYSPLQTGLRFLPSTVVIVFMSQIAGRLADRVGSRPLMTLGLVVVGLSIFIQTHITVHSNYTLLATGFVLMGAGMGLVMSPMSTAAMNAVDRTKAGAASGVLSMSRMVGSTFGVAAMGAIVTTVGKSKLDALLPNVADSTRAKIAASLGSGAAPTGHAPATVVNAVQQAFVSALRSGLTVGVVVVLIGAVAAWLLVQPRPATAPQIEAGESAEPALDIAA